MPRKNSLGELQRLLEVQKDLEKESREMRKQLERLAPFMPKPKRLRRSSEGSWTSCKFAPWQNT